MKKYFYLFLIFLSFNCFSQATSIDSMGENLPDLIKRTGAMEPNGPFFLISHGMVIYNFEQLNDPDGNRFYKYRRDWFHKQGLSWRTVSIKELEPLGLKEGSTFKYVEWDQNIVKEYKLKKLVHLAMVPNDFYEGSPTDLFYRTFYIVLKDSVEGLKHPGPANSDSVTGVAYNGSEYSLKPSVEINGSELESLPKLETQKNRELAEYYLSRHKKIATINEVKITDLSFDSLKLYFVEKPNNTQSEKEESNMVILKSSDNSLKELPVLSPSSPISEIRFSNFIKESEITILKGQKGMHSCYELILFKDNKEKKFKLMCDSGGC